MTHPRWPFLAATACFAAGLFQASTLTATDVGRTTPPSTLACPRDQLTSYDGVVARYVVDDDGATLAIETDWDTVEAVHVAADDLPGAFLRFGEPVTWVDGAPVGFTPTQGMRATAWICLDGKTPPVIDWRPGERGPRAR